MEAGGLYSFERVTMETNYSTVLRGFIVENFLFGDDTGLDENASFLESGIVDSTGMLEIISFLEATFHITIEDDELIPGNFDCLVKLNAFLARKLNGNPIKAMSRKS